MNKAIRSVFFLFISVIIWFFVLEVASRIIVSIYSRSPSYLTYGFTSIFHKNLERKFDTRPVFRIACFGGSTTVGRPGSNYPLFLQEYLQDKYPAKNIVVENFGICGATTTEASYILRSSIDMDIQPRVWGMPQEKLDRLCGPERYTKIPNLVFLYSELNACLVETLRLKQVLSEEEYKSIKRLSNSVTLGKRSFLARLAFGMNYYLKSKSFLFYSLSRVIFWLQHDRYLFPPDTAQSNQDIISTSVQRIQKNISRLRKSVKTENYEEALSMAIFTAKRLHVPIIVGTEPIASRKNVYIPIPGTNPRLVAQEEEAYSVVHGIYTDAIRKICNDNNIALFDGVKLFSGIDNSDRLFYDRLHPGDEGDRIIAKHLGDLIIKNDYVK